MNSNREVLPVNNLFSFNFLPPLSIKLIFFTKSIRTKFLPTVLREPPEIEIYRENKITQEY